MDLTSVKNEYIRNESELGSRYFPKELDFSLSYEYKGLSLAVTDYWFSSDAYFKYKKHNSSHLFEGTVGYDFGFLSLSWNTIFAGADYKENGDRAYSSYFDVSVPFKICGIDWSATMGAAPFKSDVYGSSGFSVINCALGASKEFVISDKITLPVSATLVANPRSDSMYFVFALSF